MRRAFGTILPSSNRMVERATGAVLRCFPEVDACFARVAYHGAGVGYDMAAYREAARLLAHAGVEAVCWNGSRGAALGLAADEALCAAMAEAAGCAATTAALGTREVLRGLGARRLGLVVQGEVGEAQAAAAGLGGELVAARGLGVTDNLAAAAVAPGVIASAVRDVTGARPDAVLVWSTNLAGFEVAGALEAELGVTVVDAASAGVWAGLRALGVDTAAARAMGRMFGLGCG